MKENDILIICHSHLHFCNSFSGCIMELITAIMDGLKPICNSRMPDVATGLRDKPHMLYLAALTITLPTYLTYQLLQP